MSVRNDILEQGYFPKELPPTYGTQSLAAAISADTGGITTSILAKPKWTHLCTHSLARPGSIRRRLGIPNPTSFVPLTDVIDRNYTAIDAVINRSKFSLSTPTSTYGSPRAFIPKLHDGSLPDSRAEHRASAKYLVQADIANFYPSIYTHSVPWAIESRAAAKARLFPPTTPPGTPKPPKTPPTYGDEIDKALQSCNSGQTVGLPIGPDTSLIVSEIILSEIDRLLVQNAPPISGMRYYDDYELSYPTASEAANGLAVLQSILAEYQLALNPHKSSVIEMLQPLDKPWVSRLRSFVIPTDSERRMRVALLTYFDTALEFARAFPSDNVIEYAVGRLWKQIESGDDLSSAFDLLRNLVMQVLHSRPSASVECYQLLLILKSKKATINLDRLRSAISSVVRNNAAMGHSSEVAWAVWACMVFGLKVDSDVATALSASGDDIVALLAMDLDSRGLVDGGLDRTRWEPLMTEDNLMGEHWLLAYEAKTKNWLPSYSSADHVMAHPIFRLLKAANVNFYDGAALNVEQYVPPSPVTGSP